MLRQTLIINIYLLHLDGFFCLFRRTSVFVLHKDMFLVGSFGAAGDGEDHHLLHAVL